METALALYGGAVVLLCLPLVALVIVRIMVMLWK